MNKMMICALASFFVVGVQATIKIEPYKKERDAVFIKTLIEQNKHDFYDADLVPDFESASIDVTVPVQAPETKTVNISLTQKVYVCCVDEKPVGFVRVFNLGQGAGLIAQIAVAPEYRRKGYGTRLLQKGVEALKEFGVQQIILDTLEDNKIAFKLYEKVGFQKVAEMEGHCFYAYLVS